MATPLKITEEHIGSRVHAAFQLAEEENNNWSEVDTLTRAESAEGYLKRHATT